MSKNATRQQRQARDEANASARHWRGRADRATDPKDKAFFDKAADERAADAVRAQRAIDRDPSQR